MRFSRFTPFGMSQFSGNEPRARRIYHDLLANYGVEGNFPDDENLKGELYADAMLTAAAQQLCDKVLAELHPLSASQMLELHEHERGLVARASQTPEQRRRLLYVLRRLNVDGRVSTISQALGELRGDDLRFYRTVRTSELSTREKNINSASNHVGWNVPIRIMRLTVPLTRPARFPPAVRLTQSGLQQLAVSGWRVRIPVEFVAGSPEPYTRGQYVTVNPGDYARCERVQLVGVDDGHLEFVALKPHDAGTLVTSGNHAREWTTKRTHQIVLRNGMAADEGVRASIDIVMRRLVKGSAIWNVVDEAVVTNRFRVGASPLALSSIGTIAG